LIERQPYSPSIEEWPVLYGMLCGHCLHNLSCDITEAMIEMKEGAPWPEGGWVTDPGAQVTCLSYAPIPQEPLARAERRRIAHRKEEDLPPVCGGCAARKGSEASVSLHTQRDYQAAVRDCSPFTCHEDPALKRLCGGWCRAIAARGGKRSPKASR
jgi:hypothetical protein